MTHPLTGKRVANEHGMVGTILSVHNGMAHIEYPRWRPNDGYAVLVIGVDALEASRLPFSPAPEIDPRFPDVD